MSDDDKEKEMQKDKVIDFIVEMAKVEEKAVSIEELTRDPDEETESA